MLGAGVTVALNRCLVEAESNQNSPQNRLRYSGGGTHTPGARLLPRLFRILPKPRSLLLLGTGLVLPQWVVSFDFLGREMGHANTYK